MVIARTRPWEERFDDMHMPEPNSGCWLWFGGHDRNGYGGFKSRSTDKTQKCHRISYTRHVGPIPEGLHILHKCDTPACVNPDHLYAATHSDNMADKMRRGRHVVGENSAPLLKRNQTHCIHGHEFSPENTYHRTCGGRTCRACQSAATRRYKLKRKEMVA